MKLRNVVLLVIVIVMVLAVVAPLSASASAIGISKLATNVPQPENCYQVGDTVNYTIRVSNPDMSTNKPWTVDVIDTLPDGTSLTLETGLHLNPGESKDYTVSWTIVAPFGPGDEVLNQVCAEGYETEFPYNYVSACGEERVYICEPLDPPTAILRGSGCAPDPVTLDGCGSHANEEGATIVKYEWDFENDGTYDRTTTSCTTTYTWTVAGDYEVKLRVTDSNGLTDDVVKTFHIPPCPTPTPTPPTDVPATTPTSIALMVGLIAIIGVISLVFRRRD